MALDAYNELKKSRDTSSSRSSLHDPSRFSVDSDQSAAGELDPLQANGFKEDFGGSNGVVAYANGKRESSPFPVYNRRGKLKDGRSRWGAALERWLPLDQLRRLLTLRQWRRVRRPMLTVGRSPGRICCFVAAFISLLVLLLTASTGVYMVKKGTIDGQSPPWYPTPLGGTVKSWEESYAKAEKLVRQMTLAEKVNITTGTGWKMGMCVGNTGPAMKVKFPGLCLQDGPLGIRYADKVTASPAGVTVGSTWNKELMYKRGAMIGLEARVKGINVLLGPSVGPIGRMPAGGRNWEGFGADPVLQGIAAAETIKGIQDQGVMATIKHYVGNEQERYRRPREWGLPNAISSNIDDRPLHEIYAWPFADSVRAGVASVMCSYNQVNNSYACQNSKLINGILKDELGFQGFVQSDWLAQRSGVASALAGLDMTMPGDGLVWEDGKSLWGAQLSMAVLNGSVPVQRLNDMVTRIVAAWHQVGQDDKAKWPAPPPDGDGGPNFSSWTDEEEGLLHPGSDDKTTGNVNQQVAANRAGSSSHRSLARKIASEGIILLKNVNGILPLNRSGLRKDDADEVDENSPAQGRRFHVAVFGEDSAVLTDGPNKCPDLGCNHGTLASGWGSGAVEFQHLSSPVEALRSRFKEEDVFLTAFANNKLPSKQNSTLVEYQDLCIVFANADSGEGYIHHDGIFGDRPDLKLQKGGEELVKDVAAHCGMKNVQNRFGKGIDAKYKHSPTIVVIHSVGPVILEGFIDDGNVQAVVLANLPGQESGDSLADVLFGDETPSGRLPYTIGKSLQDYGPGGQVLYVPNSFPVPQQNFSEGVLIDYRWFDSHNIQPRFEFGFGLSYTKFTLKELHVTPVEQNIKKSIPRPADEAKPPQYVSKTPNIEEILFPKEIRKLKKYIYPYISDKESVESIDVVEQPDLSQNLRKLSQAGGGEGGNPALWETVAEVEVTVSNEGSYDGQAVVQLYVKFPEEVYEQVPGPNPKREKIEFPPRVLRGFYKAHTYTRQDSDSGFYRASAADANDDDEDRSTRKVRFSLTRRDLSYWSVRLQNWILPRGQFEIQVGFSSRDIQLKETLF